MATSQNGYSVYEQAGALDKAPLKGTDVTFPQGLRPDDCAVVLRYVMEQLNARVEKARKGWCWGWAYRPIRGMTTGFSNHASATAFDYNAPTHSRQTRDRYLGFTTAQVAEIHKILKEVDGVVRWGGDYKSGQYDPMHFEINSSYADVQAVAKKLKGGTAPSAGKYGTYEKVAAGTRTLSKFDAGDDVKKLQFILNRWYGNLNLTEDGYFGAATEDGVKYMQGRAKLTADGVVGAKTWAALNVI